MCHIFSGTTLHSFWIPNFPSLWQVTLESTQLFHSLLKVIRCHLKGILEFEYCSLSLSLSLYIYIYIYINIYIYIHPQRGPKSGRLRERKTVSVGSCVCALHMCIRLLNCQVCSITVKSKDEVRFIARKDCYNVKKNQGCNTHRSVVESVQFWFISETL